MRPHQCEVSYKVQRVLFVPHKGDCRPSQRPRGQEHVCVSPSSCYTHVEFKHLLQRERPVTISFIVFECEEQKYL